MWQNFTKDQNFFWSLQQIGWMSAFPWFGELKCQITPRMNYYHCRPSWPIHPAIHWNFQWLGRIHPDWPPKSVLWLYLSMSLTINAVNRSYRGSGGNPNRNSQRRLRASGAVCTILATTYEPTSKCQTPCWAPYMHRFIYSSLARLHSG